MDTYLLGYLKKKTKTIRGNKEGKIYIVKILRYLVYF